MILRQFIFLILSPWLFPLACASQLIDCTQRNFIEDRLYFNEEQIAANGIHFCEIGYLKKTNNRPLATLEDFDRYEFDSDGITTSWMSIRTTRISKDTSWTKWKYLDGLLVSKETRDALGLYRSELEYDEKGRIIESRRYRNEIYVNQETYSYPENNSGHTQEFYNSDGKRYKRMNWEYNPLGYLIREKTNFDITGRKTVMEFEYKESGFVHSISQESEDGKSVQFKYSDLGEPILVKFSKKGKIVEELEFIYEGGNLHSYIRRDPETNNMKIGKFSFGID